MKLNVNHLTALIFCIIVMPLFNAVAKNVFFLLSILVVTVMLVSYLRQTGFRLRIGKQKINAAILTNGMLIISYTLFNVVLNGFTSSVLERIMQLYLCSAILLVTSEYHWKPSDFLFCIRAIQCVVLLCLLVWPFSGFKTNYYGGIFAHGNAMGGALFCYMGIYLCLPRKFSLMDMITILVMLILMYFANSRSVFLAFAVFIVFRFLFRYKVFHRKIILFVLIAAFTLFPYVYMLLYQSELRNTLDQLSWMYFRKRFFSGRQYLWGPILDYINQRFLFGFGLHVTPETLLGGMLSSHNWYIQILLQMGIIGYSLLVNNLRIVWNTLWALRGNLLSINTGAFLIGVLLWQCFEVSITQNNFTVGIMIWLVLGMGINKSLIDLSSNRALKPDQQSGSLSVRASA